MTISLDFSIIRLLSKDLPKLPSPKEPSLSSSKIRFLIACYSRVLLVSSLSIDLYLSFLSMDLYNWAILLAESSSADILLLPKDISNLAILASDSSWASLFVGSSSA